jgi:predicted acyltransferase
MTAGETLPLQPTPPARLASLDVFRGVVILSMLVVNNLGDYGSTGYWWKHADWPEPWFAQSWAQWWSNLRNGSAPLHTFLTHNPIFRFCTLADYVMPHFMLIIGLSIPFSAASSRARGDSTGQIFARTMRRALALVALGWVLCYFRDQFAGWLYAPEGSEKARFRVHLGMDVLQLLGFSYLFSRALYLLPMGRRLAACAVMFLAHWAVLRFGYQGPDVPLGTFDSRHNAIGYINRTWGIFQSFDLLAWGPESVRERLTVSFASLMSSIPATATMLLGTVAGDALSDPRRAHRDRLRRLVQLGFICAVAGLAWGFDLPWNKPRWTSSYLLWTSGIGLLLLAGLYWVIDQHGARGWIRPFVALGSNAIAAYFLTIMLKVLLLNTPRVTFGGEIMSLNNALMLTLKGWLGPWAGGWAFTLGFVAFWWILLDVAYRRKWIWRV